jgi:hypothetical protein
MARAGIQVEAVEFFQILYALEAFRAKGAFPIEGVKHNALEQIAKRHIAILTKGFKDLQDPLFHANAGLHAFNDKLLFFRHVGPPL